MAVKSSMSLTDEQHAFARGRLDAQELEHAAMRELLSHRREDEFVSAQAMDTRLARMIADKRRAHGLPRPA